MTSAASTQAASRPFAAAALPGFGLAMIGVALFAILVRWLGYTGYFGSDEVTYIASAFKPLAGDWRVDSYVGASRLGVNLPMAASAALFGRNEFGAALYSLACSVGEVLLVTWVGWRAFGRRAGIFAGLLLATLPTHVHFAGRIMADAPLALMISASFVCFFEGELRGSSRAFFLAGVCAGLSYWIKPITTFVFAILLFYPLLARRFDLRWGWMVVGLLVAVAVNGLVFLVLTGSFLYVFESMIARRQTGFLESGAAAGTIFNSPTIYLEYLFGKIYHTGLLGYLAAIGLAAMAAARREPAQSSIPRAAARYVVFWGLGLLLVLSVLPVKFNPLLFVPKQTNYMLIFAAPLCVLAGYGVSRLPTRWGWPLLIAAMAIGLLCALALQASVALFAANSWRTVEYARQHPEKTLYVMANAYQAARFETLVQGRSVLAAIRPMNELPSASTRSERYAVIDPETFTWDSQRPFARVADVPACWQPLQTLVGTPEGRGIALLHAARRIADAVPPLSALAPRLRAMTEPRPARLYRLPAGC